MIIQAFYCKLYFVLTIPAYNECSKRGQTSRAVVRVEIQTSCNFKANICVCSNGLDYVSFFSILERFSFECRKTKTKVITLANHKEHRQYSEPIKTRK